MLHSERLQVTHFYIVFIFNCHLLRNVAVGDGRIEQHVFRDAGVATDETSFQFSNLHWYLFPLAPNGIAALKLFEQNHAFKERPCVLSLSLHCGYHTETTSHLKRFWMNVIAFFPWSFWAHCTILSLRNNFVGRFFSQRSNTANMKVIHYV